MGMGEVLREFGVKVSLNFDSKKIDAAETKIKKFGSEMRSFALEIAGMTAAVFESQNLFTSNARSLQNQADMLGINTEALQEYEYAAKVAANMNREDLVSSMETLATTMDKARAGDVEARQALENIGGAMGNQSAIIGKLNDKNYTAAQAMLDVSGGIEKISKSSPIAAKRLLEMAMGSDKLYNMMRQGPKAIQALTEEGKKNFALSAKTIKQGYEMDIQMSKLWLMFRKMGYEIGFSVMKHLTPMINAFTKWFVLNKKVIASGINAFLDALANGLEIVFTGATAVWKVMEPLIEAMGGMKTAMSVLISTFLVFKAINIVGAFVGMIGPILGLLPSLTALGGVLSGLGEAFAVFTEIGALADILPAITLFGEGALAALAPLLPVMLGIGAAAVGIHDLAVILSGGAFKDTWTGKGFDKAKTAFSSVSGIGAGLAGKAGSVAPSGYAAFGGGGAANPAPVTQENHFHTENNISVPPGTTPHAAAHMISKANVDSHENMMVKAKMDAARSKVY
jgi:hypothetical protein